jgi:hypothetical protein
MTESVEALRPAEALLQADELEAAGRPDEAIMVLSTSNRRQRNAKVERRLVDLRHRAFGRRVVEPGHPTWPVAAPDLFSGSGGLPEVGAGELGADVVRSAITNHGSLIVRGLLDQRQVSCLVDDIDHALDAAERHLAGDSSAETAPWWRPFKPDAPYEVGGGRHWIWDQGSVWAVDSPRALFDLLEILGEIGLISTIREYLGEWPALSVKKCTLRRVPATTGTNWHQDGAFLGEGIRTLNVWIALSLCGDDSPSLDVVPQRLDGIVETGTAGAAFDWSVGEPVVAGILGGRNVVRPRFAPGDAMLFDERFLHRTGVSPGMTRDRYTIESWFFAPSSYPHDQIPIAV